MQPSSNDPINSNSTQSPSINEEYQDSNQSDTLLEKQGKMTSRSVKQQPEASSRTIPKQSVPPQDKTEVTARKAEKPEPLLRSTEKKALQKRILKNMENMEKYQKISSKMLLLKSEPEYQEASTDFKETEQTLNQIIREMGRIKSEFDGGRGTRKTQRDMDDLEKTIDEWSENNSHIHEELDQVEAKVTSRLQESRAQKPESQNSLLDAFSETFDQIDQLQQNLESRKTQHEKNLNRSVFYEDAEALMEQEQKRLEQTRLVYKKLIREHLPKEKNEAFRKAAPKLLIKDATSQLDTHKLTKESLNNPLVCADLFRKILKEAKIFTHKELESLKKAYQKDLKKKHSTKNAQTLANTVQTILSRKSTYQTELFFACCKMKSTMPSQDGNTKMKDDDFAKMIAPSLFQPPMAKAKKTQAQILKQAEKEKEMNTMFSAVLDTQTPSAVLFLQNEFDNLREQDQKGEGNIL